MEDRLTVFWMLTTLFAIAAMALGLAAVGYDAYVASDADRPRVTAVVDYARFVTALMSLLLLALTPLVLWMRKVVPPRAITIFVLATATVGLAWALWGRPSGTGAAPRDSGVRATSP